MDIKELEVKIKLHSIPEKMKKMLEVRILMKEVVDVLKKKAPYTSDLMEILDVGAKGEKERKLYLAVLVWLAAKETIERGWSLEELLQMVANEPEVRARGIKYFDKVVR